MNTLKLQNFKFRGKNFVIAAKFRDAVPIIFLPRWNFSDLQNKSVSFQLIKPFLYTSDHHADQWLPNNADNNIMLLCLYKNLLQLNHHQNSLVFFVNEATQALQFEETAHCKTFDHKDASCMSECFKSANNNTSNLSFSSTDRVGSAEIINV